jgi:hypothetical protein
MMAKTRENKKQEILDYIEDEVNPEDFLSLREEDVILNKSNENYSEDKVRYVEKAVPHYREKKELALGTLGLPISVVTLLIVLNIFFPGLITPIVAATIIAGALAAGVQLGIRFEKRSDND